MEWGTVEYRLGHCLVHHILAEDRRAAKFVPGAQFFIYLPRKIIMGCGVSVKWLGDDDVFNGSLHFSL